MNINNNMVNLSYETSRINTDQKGKNKHIEKEDMPDFVGKFYSGDEFLEMMDTLMLENRQKNFQNCADFWNALHPERANTKYIVIDGVSYTPDEAQELMDRERVERFKKEGYTLVGDTWQKV